MLSIRPVLALALLGLLASHAPAQSGAVRHVPADHPTVQAAVLAASSDDVILIAGGIHGGDVDIVGKGLSLVGDQPASPPRLTGAVSVRNTLDGQPVLFQGLRLWSEKRRPALTVKDCDGVVRLEACDVRGLSGFLQPNDPVIPGYPGVRVERSRGVAVAGCQVTGGSGALFDQDEPEYTAGPGATGLVAIDAGVAVTGSLVRGGSGGSVDVAEPDGGGSGGHGIESVSSVLVLAGAEVLGGQGGSGDCDFFGCGSGGPGGIGLRQSGDETARTWLRGTLIEGGEGGQSGDGTPTGPATDMLVLAGSVETWHPFPGSLSVTSPRREGESGQIEAAGGGGVLGLLVSVEVDHLLLPGNVGVLQVGDPTTFVLGSPPEPGEPLALPFDVPADGLAGLPSLLLRIQAASVSPLGTVLLEPAATLVLLDDGA